MVISSIIIPSQPSAVEPPKFTALSVSTLNLSNEVEAFELFAAEFGNGCCILSTQVILDYMLMSQPEYRVLERGNGLIIVHEDPLSCDNITTKLSELPPWISQFEWYDIQWRG